MAGGRSRQISELEASLVYRATGQLRGYTEKPCLEGAGVSLKLSSINILIFMSLKKLRCSTEKVYSVHGKKQPARQQKEHWLLKLHLKQISPDFRTSTPSVTGPFRGPINPIKFDCQLVFIPGSIPGLQIVSSTNVLPTSALLKGTSEGLFGLL